MYRLQNLASLDQPDLVPYRTMRWQADQRRQGFFVAEGDKVIQRLLESSHEIVSMVLEQRWVDLFRPLMDQRKEDFTVYVAPKQELDQLTGYHLFQGALAVARVPQQPPLGALLSRFPRPLLLVALDGINNAENTGVITRNSAAYGVQILISGKTSCSPYLRRAVRASMGAIFRLQVFEGLPLPEVLSQLRAHGVRCVAAHPHASQQNLSDINLRRDCCLVFGSEGEGLDAGVLAACDEAAAIPMFNQVDSLNVGSATASFLYETQRQRFFALPPASKQP
ncbi:MAG: RNA methyltransferase [Verrucomicrobiae bacterium]|nr:RNA methyltransferase [Verrucomicrobiae bacterium]